MNNVFFQLLRKDLLSFGREYRSKLTDTCILFFTNVVVFGYFFPQQGMNQSYGPFLLVSAIGSFGLIEIVGKASVLMSDLDGDQVIAQKLIMPIRSEFVFGYIAIFWAVTSFLLSVLLFPLGKLLLFSQFDLSAISYVRLIPMFLTTNLFFGFFGLWLTSVLKGIGGLNVLWIRFIAPLWMFGSYFYPWKASYATSVWVGYITLLNPVTYAMEGMHAACLGQEGFLPFWICLTILWMLIFCFGFFAVRRLKRRLDAV